MTKKSTSDYYDAHWAIFANQQYPQAKLLQAARFFSPVIDKIHNNHSVLDIGCGDGVHWYYLKKSRDLPIQYTGIDVAQQSIDFLTKMVSDKQDTFMQMDACDLQFDNDLFDYVFAYGVIGYTDFPFKAFVEMTRVCKPGGFIGVFSPEIKGVSRVILNATRGIAQLFGKSGQRVLADLMVPFFGLAPSETGINLKNATWQQVREVILTDIAPPHLTIFSHQDVVNWYEEKGIMIISDDRQIHSILWGKKPESVIVS